MSIKEGREKGNIGRKGKVDEKGRGRKGNRKARKLVSVKEPEM